MQLWKLQRLVSTQRFDIPQAPVELAQTLAGFSASGYSVQHRFMILFLQDLPPLLLICCFSAAVEACLPGQAGDLGDLMC